MRFLLLLFIFVFSGYSILAAVSFKQLPDRSVSVTTSVYSAAFDAKGNLTDLNVKGVRVLGHRFGSPGKPDFENVSVNLVNDKLAVRSGDARIELTFKEDTIHVITEGYNFECQLDDGIKSLVVAGGKGGPYNDSYYAGSSAIVLRNGLTVAYSMPMHAGPRRMVPTCYCNMTKKAGDLLEFDFSLGFPADAVQLLSGITLQAVGNDDKGLKKDGNQGYGLVHFPDPKKVILNSKQQNLSDTPFTLTYRCVVLDHYVAGKEVMNQQREASLKAQGECDLTWTFPEMTPGFYYATVSCWQGDKKLTEAKLTLTVDLEHYTRPTTRPADFAQFWERQNQRLAQTPANAVTKLISTPENTNKAYQVTLDMPDGNKLRGCLFISAELGKGPAILGSRLGTVLNEMQEKAKKPDFVPEDKGVSFIIELPEDGTFKRWTSAEDNNLLQCILAYLRACDFLAARPEVDSKRIMTVGASRSGPLAFITSALRPDNICGVDAFVHTSAGLSWEDKPYSAWGVPSGHKPTDPAQVKRLATMAAYVDPINFAKDVTCPVIFAYGIDDDLAPPQGIEALYHLTPSAWKRISRDFGGHQCSNGCRQLQRDLHDLLDAGPVAPDEHTIKDH